MDEYDEYHFNFWKKKQRIKNGIPLDGKQRKMVKIVSIKRYNAQYRIQPLIRWMIEGEWNEQRIKSRFESTLFSKRNCTGAGSSR